MDVVGARFLLRLKRNDRTTEKLRKGKADLTSR